MTLKAIYGTGFDGRRLHRALRKKNIKINFFLDNNPKLHKSKFFKILIFCPNKSLEQIKKIDTIYLGGRYMDEQENYLKSIKFPGKIIKTTRWEYAPSKNDLKTREKILVDLLEQIIKILNTNNIKYFIDCSSLLALIRKQNLSDFSDVDIALPGIKLKKIFNLLKSKMRRCTIKAAYFKFNNFLIKKNSLIQITIISRCNSYNTEPVVIELYNENLYKNHYRRYIPHGYMSKIPLVYRDQSILKNYKNLKLNITKFYKSQLKFYYGYNWRLKSKSWKEAQSKRIFKRIKISK